MRKIYLLLGLWLLLYQIGWTQTTNTGMLYIAPDTKFSTLAPLNNQEDGQLFNDGEVIIYSHLNNDGEFDFYQQTGIIKFTGTNEQTLDGLNTSYFHNVYFGNASSPIPYRLFGFIDIHGVADFSQGILDNDSYGGQITFRQQAETIHVSHSSHVNGPVYKIGDAEFTFPIGNANYYRPAGISPPGLGPASFRANYFYHNSNLLYSHDLKDDLIEEIDDKEYWNIEEKVTAREEMLITLSWNEATTPSSLIAAAQQEDLSIVRWDAEENKWINEGGAIDLDSQQVTTVVSGFGTFTLARIKPKDTEPCEVIVYNAITPNGDGKNDYFRIETGKDECTKNLQVMIFNRWGVKVFESHNYGVNGDVFDGYSSGRLTLADSKKLPSGTYYYILNYEYQDSANQERQKKAGFLYLSGN